MNYKHININERYCIANFLELGWSIRKIAKHLNIIKRSKDLGDYLVGGISTDEFKYCKIYNKRPT